MQKTKLKIKGMHCASCSKLIENQLSEQEGIKMSKVNYESGKAVVVYDKNMISEEKIIGIIEDNDDYSIVREENEKLDNHKAEEVFVNDCQTVSLLNNLVAYGAAVGISIVSVILNIVLILIIINS